MSKSPPADRLFLHEEILLLSLDDETGKNTPGGMHVIALGGALLGELLLHERVRVDDDRRKRLRIVDPTPIGEPLLDRGLAKIADAKRPVSAVSWIAKLAYAKEARLATLERMCDRGLLRAEQRPILGIFPRTVYPEVDPGPERALRARIEQMVTGGDARDDERTALLIAIANPSWILRGAFGKAWGKRYEKRITSITEQLEAGEATRAAIAAAQAVTAANAATAAVIVTTVT